MLMLTGLKHFESPVKQSRIIAQNCLKFIFLSCSTNVFICQNYQIYLHNVDVIVILKCNYQSKK